jgi:hypothetical protein
MTGAGNDGPIGPLRWSRPEPDPDDQDEADPADPAVGARPAAAAGNDAPPLIRAWRAFRAWRRSRPFWGGLLILLGGAEISLTELAPLKVIIHLGAQGLAGEAIPVVMIVCGLLLLFSPEQRLFYAIIAMASAAVSWVTSNLGGFILGLLLGLTGGSMAIAWAPLRGRDTAGRRPRRARGRRARSAPTGDS